MSARQELEQFLGYFDALVDSVSSRPNQKQWDKLKERVARLDEAYSAERDLPTMSVGDLVVDNPVQVKVGSSGVPGQEVPAPPPENTQAQELADIYLKEHGPLGPLVDPPETGQQMVEMDLTKPAPNAEQWITRYADHLIRGGNSGVHNVDNETAVEIARSEPINLERMPEEVAEAQLNALFPA